MKQQLQTLVLPIALTIGFLFSDLFAGWGGVTPYLIFIMLFITFCGIAPSQMRFSKLYLWLLLIQVGGSLAVYGCLLPFGHTVAQGIMICVLAPTATSAVVIAGMLGANITTMATYTLLSNIAVAGAAPVIFSYVGQLSDIPFWESFIMILSKVGPLLVLPFVAALLIKKLAPGAAGLIKRVGGLSFYLWSLALMIVTGQTVEFIAAEQPENYSTEILIAGISLILCVLQFLAGRRIGKRYGDTVAGGQSLGQKNTVLAIWMSQVYLDPVSSIGPASYVLWQNLVNSFQIWRKQLYGKRAVKNGDGKPES